MHERPEYIKIGMENVAFDVVIKKMANPAHNIIANIVKFIFFYLALLVMEILPFQLKYGKFIP